MRKILITAILLLYLFVAHKVFAGSSTGIGDYEPSAGGTSYATIFNKNFDKLDYLAQGWVQTGWTYTYVNGTTYNITGNMTGYLAAGQYVNVNNGGVWTQGIIQSVTWSNPNTVIVLTTSICTSAMTGTGTVNHAIPLRTTLLPQVAVSNTDSTPNYLLSKLTAGTNITLTKLNGGSNETVQITASGGVTAGANVGAGVGIFKQLSGSTLQFLSITSTSVNGVPGCGGGPCTTLNIPNLPVGQCQIYPAVIGNTLNLELDCCQPNNDCGGGG